MHGALHSQDLPPLLALVARSGDIAFAHARISATPETLEASLRPCPQSARFAAIGRKVRRTEHPQFLLHEVRHVVPGEAGDQPRLGVPTSLSGPPLRTSIVPPPAAAIVWAHPHSTIDGLSLRRCQHG